MKSLLLTATLFIASSTCIAIEKEFITLPSAEVLRQRFNEKGFQHFVEKTKINEKLAAQELYPLGVAVAVENHLYDYSECVKNSMIAQMMQNRKREIIEILLRDHPKALAELIQKLENYGALEKN